MMTNTEVQARLSQKAVADVDTARPKSGPGADPMIWVLSGVLTILGLLVIQSAGFPRAIANGGSPFAGDFRNQLIFGVGAVLIAVGIAKVPGRHWFRWTYLLFAAAYVLLLLVKVIGKTQNGATRWIDVGPFDIQPAEFMKVAAIMFVAAILARRQPWKRIRRAKDFKDYFWRVAGPKVVRLIPLGFILGAVICIEKEPDLGTAAVVAVTCWLMFVFGGITRKSAVIITVLGVMLVGFLVTKEPYRIERVHNHFARWEADRIDDVGYQTVQSEIGMANGSWLGVGPGAGRVKHMMPAATTDFAFATVAEEFGLAGVWALLGLLAYLTWRIVELGRRCVHVYARGVCYGVAVWMTVQGAVNLMMANGTLPAIGIPFPFISYGGSSLVATWIAIGLVQSVAGMSEPRPEPLPQPKAKQPKPMPKKSAPRRPLAGTTVRGSRP